MVKRNENNIFVDTDILIDYSKGYSKDLNILLEKQSKGKIFLYVNPVVIAEFFTDENLKDSKYLSQTLKFIQLFSIENITKKTGLKAGQFMRDKEILFIGDALIAATCIEKNYLLFTRNKKHFKKVHGLSFWQS